MNQSTFKSPLCSVLIISLNSLDYSTPHAPPFGEVWALDCHTLNTPELETVKAEIFESRACYCVEERITELRGPCRECVHVRGICQVSMQVKSPFEGSWALFEPEGHCWDSPSQSLK